MLHNTDQPVCPTDYELHNEWKIWGKAGWAFLVGLALQCTGFGAERASFTAVGDLAGGSFVSGVRAVSEDGTAAAGGSDSTNAPDNEAFCWTRAGGIRALGDLEGGAFRSVGDAISADGLTVVGGSASAAAMANPLSATAGVFLSEAFRWTVANPTLTPLGDLPGGAYFSYAFGVSADGNTVVGSSASTKSAANTFSNGTPCKEAFRWAQIGGMQGLGALQAAADRRFHSEAFSISADGSVIVGYSDTALQSSAGTRFHAVKWNAAGQITDLGKLSGGTDYAKAYAVSGNGRIIVGESSSTNANGSGNYEAFRYEDGVMRGLGDFSGGDFDSRAQAVSDTGVIVGWGTTDAGKEAFIRRPVESEMRSLRTVLIEEYGLTEVAGWKLTEARAISRDGRTIGGVGTNPSGKVEGWVARLMPGSLLDPRPGFTPVVKFTQTYSETIATDNTDPDFTVRVAVPHGSGSLSIVVPMEGIDPAALTESTIIEYRLGQDAFSDTLGNGGWSPGKTSATYVLETSDDPEHPRRVGSIKCSWNTKSFTIVANSSDPYFVQPLDGTGPEGEFDPDNETKFAGVNTVSVRIGSVSGERKVYFRGTFRRVEHVFGSDGVDVIWTHALSASGAANYTGPKVTIKAPKNNLRTNAPTATILIASPGADSVEVQFGAEANTSAIRGEEDWEATVDLIPGPNVITVRATGIDGIESLAMLSITYAKLAGLTVSKTGSGQVPAALLGSTQQLLGAAVKLTATPAAGFVFAEWTRVLGTSETVLTYTPSLSYIHDTAGVELRARFIPNPFLASAGTYTAYSIPSVDGDPVILTIVLGKPGSFTGKLVVAGKTYPVNGGLRPDGSYLGATAKGEKHFGLSFDLAQPGLGKVEAFLADANGNPTQRMVGNRAVFSAKNPALADAVGTYNALLTDRDPGTSRHGYMKWTLSATGTVRLAGALEDGNKFTAGSNLSGEMKWHFDAPLAAGGHLTGAVAVVAGQGFVGEARCRGGKTRITTGATDSLWALQSEKFLPRGAGARVLASLETSGGSAVFSFSSPRFTPNPLTARVAISSQNRFVAVTPVSGDPRLKTLTIDSKGGAFQGTFQPFAGRALVFSGVFISTSQEGAGLFFGPDFSGTVHIVPEL